MADKAGNLEDIINLLCPYEVIQIIKIAVIRKLFMDFDAR